MELHCCNHSNSVNAPTNTHSVNQKLWRGPSSHRAKQADPSLNTTTTVVKASLCFPFLQLKVHHYLITPTTPLKLSLSALLPPLIVSHPPPYSLPVFCSMPPMYAWLSSEKACPVSGPEPGWWALDEAAVLWPDSSIVRGWSTLRKRHRQSQQNYSAAMIQSGMRRLWIGTRSKFIRVVNLLGKMPEWQSLYLWLLI